MFPALNMILNTSPNNAKMDMLKIGISKITLFNYKLLNTKYKYEIGSRTDYWILKLFNIILKYGS